MTYGCGFLLAWSIRLLEPPRALSIAAAVAWGALALWYFGWWTVLATRDGSLRRAIPEYASAFAGLVLIAAACGLVTWLVLLIRGGPIETIDVSSGAATGTLAVLVAWWLLSGRRRANA